MLNDLVQQIASVLRFIVSPSVGFLTVFLADDKHGIIQAIAAVAWPWNGPPSSWLVTGFLAVAGVTVYYAHRTFFQWIVMKRLVAHYARRMSLPATPGTEILDTLALARWERRGAAINTAERSIQSQLDETNAVSHFFYCSGWSAILFALVFKFDFPENYVPALLGWIVLGLTVIALFVAALISENYAARLDIEAYLRFRK